MVNKPLRKKLRMLALTSLITVFAGGLIVTILHEYGHGLVCQAEGGKFEFELSLAGAVGHCEGDIQNVSLFLAMGGGIATSFSLMMALFIRRYHLGIFIGITTLAIGQFANMLLETFAYQFYLGAGGLITIQMIVLGVWMALITYYVRREVQWVKLTA